MAQCKHIWQRTNGATLMDGAESYDVHRCTKCSATGRSYGLGGDIIADSPKPKTSHRPRYYSQTYEYRKQRKERIARENRIAEQIRNGTYISGAEWSKQEYEKRIAEGKAQSG